MIAILFTLVIPFIIYSLAVASSHNRRIQIEIDSLTEWEANETLLTLAFQRWAEQTGHVGNVGRTADGGFVFYCNAGIAFALAPDFDRLNAIPAAQIREVQVHVRETQRVSQSDIQGKVQGRVGSALAGDVLLGPAGAIAGAARSRNINATVTERSVSIYENALELYTTLQAMPFIKLAMESEDMAKRAYAVLKAAIEQQPA